MKRRNNELIGILFVTVLVSVLLLSIPAALGDSTGTMAAAIELRYDFAETVIDKPVIGKIDIGEQEYDTVSIPGCDLYGAPGEPVLPVKTARILIPYGEEVRDIQVIPGKEIYLGEFYIEPGQEQVPISFTGPIAPTQPDEVIYNSDKAYPEEDYLEVSVQGMRGYQILILNLYPVKYVPKARKLSCFESMQVVVSTTASAPSELFRGVPEDRAEAAEIIDNRDILSTYDPAKASKPERSPLRPRQQYDYVIITNEALEGTGGPSNFQALRDSKIANGISATIVTTEWIYANYGGVDSQTEIRNFIIDAYNNWGTSYVLLGGDGDGTDVGGESGDAIIPARGFWTGLTSDECTPPNIPADMYYSCLDGTFDYNGNGIYGEQNDGPGGGEVDLFAEVYVGRAPVDTQAEVSNFVKKTIAYESAAFVPKALMVGEYLGWTPWGGDYKDEVKEWSANWGYTTVGFPQPPFVHVDTLYDRDYPGHNWPKSELIDRLNNNPNIVNHIGHANPTYVMKINNADADGLTNSNYFFGWTQGCYAGSFDNRWSNCNYGSSDCILEHFVVADHGAFAFIGNSRYGWGEVYTTNGASQRFDRQFWDAVFGEGIIRIGKANADSKEDNVGLIGDDVIRFCYYEINLLGDPAVSLLLGAAKPPKIVSFAPSSPVNDTVGNWRTFNVTVDQTVNVSWYLNESFLFTNDSVQEANYRLHAEVAGEHNVSAIVSNANGTDMQTWIWNVTAAPLPVLEINKTSNPDPVSPGGTLNYTIHVNNTGNATATNVTVTETYDGDVTFVSAVPAPSSGDDKWQFPTLNASETRWINISLIVNASVPNGTVLHNNITVTCDKWVTDSDIENTTVLSEELTCTCGDICVNETGWWRSGETFKLSDRSIQDAIDNATLGDTIYVMDGTYTENVDVNKQLTIQSEHGADATIVQAANPNDHVFEVTENHVTISGFTVTGATGNDKAGIYVGSADYCTISDNNASYNDYYGIWLYSSSNNTLTSNTASNNDYYGIYLYSSSDNVLTSNTASNNNYGIYLRSSNNYNVLTSNTANSNIIYGIFLESSSDNTIYNNYFNNTYNAWDDGNNIWNIAKTAGKNIIDGSWQGGNYWSGYAGNDTDGDGLGDTLLPYNSSGWITTGGDWLPLVQEPSPCFIATAAYGTPLHEDINVLRKFRDEYLMPHPAGQALVKIYYSTSPPIADLVRDNDGLRLIVREGLVKTSVYVARRFVD